MNELKKAMIFWFTEEEGGRKEPLDLPEYYPITILEDGSSWSMGIRFDRTKSTQNVMVDECEVCFLSKYAPHHLLRSSSEFIIYEGGDKVGALVIK